MITKADTVSEFLQNIDSDRKKDLTFLRKIINKTMPGIKESMMYRMPTYKLNGKAILAFNSQKNYMSFYTGSRSIKKNKSQLKGLNCGKGCIRFKDFKILNEELIVKIIMDTDGVC